MTGDSHSSSRRSPKLRGTDERSSLGMDTWSESQVEENTVSTIRSYTYLSHEGPQEVVGKEEQGNNRYGEKSGKAMSKSNNK